METIIGKRLYSKMYGQGIIDKEEDGIIWVDFLIKIKIMFVFKQLLLLQEPHHF